MKLTDYAASRNISDEEAKKAAEATGQSTHPNAKNMNEEKLDAYLGIKAPAPAAEEQNQGQSQAESQTNVKQDNQPAPKSYDDDEPPLEDPAGKKTPAPPARQPAPPVRFEAAPVQQYVQPSVAAKSQQPTHIGQFEPGMKMYLVTARTSKIASLPQSPLRCCGHDPSQAQANLLKHFNVESATSINWHTVVDSSFQHIVE